MKINYKLIITGCLLLLTTLSCQKSFLEVRPYASLSETTLSTKAGVDGLLIGAYSLLDGGGAPGAGWASAWWTIIAPDDARGGCEDSATPYNCFMIDAADAGINDRWRFLYAAVNRCNDVLILLPKVKDASAADALQIEAEAKFLRGIYYLYLAMLWKNVPWIDETVSYSANNYMVPNTEDIYPKIEADFQFAADNLTAAKSQVGRGNKWAAKAFLAKTYMFHKKFNEAKAVLDDVIPNGQTSNGKKYALLSNYGDNFKTATKNGSEAVFTAQMSVNDGANGANGNPMDYINGSFGGPATCCYGCFQPTFDLVDAYQTDAVNGLPLLDTYQNTPVKNDQGLSSTDPFTPYTGTLDSRLDWCVGRRGIPYLDWGVYPGMAWVRSQFTDGPYDAIKNIATQARVATDRQGGGGYTNTPYNLIRFADVLLWAAECEVEVGSLAKAEEYVNMVRARAADPAGWVHTYIDPAKPTAGFTNIPAANYKVGLYSGQFAANGKTYARKAVRFERRLELAMEHHRYIDMVRYDGNEFDIAARHNWVMHREGNELGFNPASNYKQGVFVKGKNELLPIPQTQIELNIKGGASVLVQNPGW
jgi:starch-binding outer membrane protein, SusD/RagB family